MYVCVQSRAHGLLHSLAIMWYILLAALARSYSNTTIHTHTVTLIYIHTHTTCTLTHQCTHTHATHTTSALTHKASYTYSLFTTASQTHVQVLYTSRMHTHTEWRPVLLESRVGWGQGIPELPWHRTCWSALEVSPCLLPASTHWTPFTSGSISHPENKCTVCM